MLPPPKQTSLKEIGRSLMPHILKKPPPKSAPQKRPPKSTIKPRMHGDSDSDEESTPNFFSLNSGQPTVPAPSFSVSKTVVPDSAVGHGPTPPPPVTGDLADAPLQFSTNNPVAGPMRYSESVPHSHLQQYEEQYAQVCLSLYVLTLLELLCTVEAPKSYLFFFFFCSPSVVSVKIIIYKESPVP